MSKSGFHEQWLRSCPYCQFHGGTVQASVEGQRSGCLGPYDAGLAQEFPLERLRLDDFRHSVPWRRVRSRHGQAHYSGSYASATTGGFVVYESRLELARLLLADFDPQMEHIYAQPPSRSGSRPAPAAGSGIMCPISFSCRLWGRPGW
jgi:hypothetical protein